MQPQTDLPGYDDSTLADLYQRHVYTLLSFIRRYVSTREDAEDVLLEVFMVAHKQQALAGLSDGEQLAWLRRVAHNKCVDIYRQTQRQMVVPLESISDFLYEDEEQAPEQAVLRSEEYALLRLHLAKLAPQQQEILHLRFAHGMRCTEIAQRLHKREGTVRTMLSRTLNLLRSTYEKQKQGESKDE